MTKMLYESNIVISYFILVSITKKE